MGKKARTRKQRRARKSIDETALSDVVDSLTKRPLSWAVDVEPSVLLDAASRKVSICVSVCVSISLCACVCHHVFLASHARLQLCMRVQTLFRHCYSTKQCALHLFMCLCPYICVSMRSSPASLIGLPLCSCTFSFFGQFAAREYVNSAERAVQPTTQVAPFFLLLQLLQLLQLLLVLLVLCLPLLRQLRLLL